MRRVLIASLSVVVAAVAVPLLGALPAGAHAGLSHAAASASPARVVWDRCAAAVPARARCGHIRVLVDPARPRWGHQRVGFELYPHRDRARPALETIVANEGGPGYPSTGSRDYYLGLFRPLLRRHDLLLVDQRGTGTSQVVVCKPLQHGTMPYVQAVTACGKQLGARADTYTSAYAANDLAAVLDALHIPTIDLYGDSYGTFFSQVFALYHPDRLHTLVLDASYPVTGNDVWWRDTNRAIRDALHRVCDRAPACSSLPGNPVARMRAVVQRVAQHPVTGWAPDSDGVPTKVTINGRTLALVTAYATYGTSIYRELDSAVRAFQAGYAKPLLRMVAENVAGSADSGAARDFSYGEYVAVICDDYPQLWDVSLPPGAQREAQYRAAVANLRATDPNAFDPFSIHAWLASAWTEPRTCIGWPSPSKHWLPPSPPNATYPHVPTLVLSGDLDSITSPEGGRAVAGHFSNATFVSISNVGHVTALGDYQQCAAGIVRRFVSSGGTVSGTGCATTANPNVRVVPRFARTSSHLVPATQGSAVHSSIVDRRVVSAAALAAGDVITRWFVNYSGSGVGLQGGQFSYTGGTTVKFRLRDLRFVRDVAATGTVVWDEKTGHVTARLHVNGPQGHDGFLTLHWDDWHQQAKAFVVGRLGGHQVRLVTGAP